MKLPIDPSHLAMPFNVVLAVAGSALSLAVATWQFVGSLLAQIPTPDQVSGWQERDVYLCTAIIFAAAIVCMARWIAVKLLKSQSDNTTAMHEMAESSAAVAEALAGLKDSINGIAIHAVEKAVEQAMPATGPGLGNTRKRSSCISPE